MTAILAVAFVDHSSERGGAELALARLLSTTQHWQATLIVPKAPAGQADAFGPGISGVDVVRGGPHHRARKARRGGPIADAALALRILRSSVRLALTPAAKRADVLIANTTRSSVYVALASSLLRKPFVVHIRDLVEQESIGAAATALMRKFVLPRAAAVIANSRASLALVAPYVSPTTIQSVIPSPAGIKVRASSDVQVTAKVSRIGMVARLDPWKGQDLLIDAFADAFADSDETLVFFGGPAFGHSEFPDHLRALASRRGIGSRVELAGHVSDVTEAIHSVDICVQSSIRPEPLGQNVLQYLAAGKPTVVSNEGGPAEWITNEVNGLAFAPRDRGSLSATLRRLADDEPLRTRLARNAASTPRLLSDDEVASEIHGLLTQVAEMRA